MSYIKPELIQKYIDRATTEKENTGIEQHLAVCPECTSRVAEMEVRAKNIRNAMNLLAGEETAIPAFVTPREFAKTRTISQRRRLLYGLSAACALVLAVTAIVFNQTTRSPQNIVVVHSIDREIDANRTVTQQSMEINVIDADGKVTRYPLK